MKSKILVLGANSFSGSYFIKYLRDVTDTNIYLVSRSREQVYSLAPHQWSSKGSYTFKQFHLVKDFDLLKKYIQDIKPNLIFNFAAQSMVAESWTKPEDWFMTNTVGFSKLINFLSNIDFLDKFIHISTPEVYGNCEGAINEDHIFNPTTPYASSRAAGDMILKNYIEAYKLPGIITRAANVYGPGQQLYRIIPKTIISILTNKKLNLHGGGISKRSFIHMNDVSEATWQLALSDKIGSTYHISTDQMISIKNLVGLICSKLEANFSDHVQIADERLGKDLNYHLSSDRLISDFGWGAKISLDDGISQTIEWLKLNLNELSSQKDKYIHKE